MISIIIIIIAIKTLILLLGGLITYLSYTAYRRTEARSLRALAIGFGFITLGAFLGGAADQLSGVSILMGLLIDTTLAGVGFIIITYSVYIQKHEIL